jgi:hypothetical protein
VLIAEGARAGVSRPPEGDCALFSLPWEVSEPVYRFNDAVPDAVADFRARNGRDWILYVDRLLGTARFAAPLGEFPLLEAPGNGSQLDRAATVAAAVVFLDANREFFGAAADELSGPRFQSLGGGLLLIFGQRTRSGVPVRGASLRVHVGADGDLRYVKSFLARGLSDAWERAGHDGHVFLSAEEAAAPALGSGWEVADQRFEVAFDDGRLDALLPLWRLHLARDGAGLVEELRDAQSGVLIQSCDIVKHFDVLGQGTGVAAPLRDLFSPPENIIEGVRQPLDGLLVTTTFLGGAQPPGLLLTQADRDGIFAGRIPGEAREPLTLLGSLATALSPGDLELCLDGRPLSDCLALTVEPYSSGLPEFCRVTGIPELDCVPGDDAVELPPAPFQLVLNEGGRRTSPAAVFESFWLQCFVHGRRVLSWSDDRIADAFAFVPPNEHPGRLSRLAIQPAETLRPQAPSYLPGIPGPHGFSSIFAPIRIVADDSWRGGNRPPAEPYPMMPTTTAHEVAHHVLWQLGAVAYTTQVEEGLADALAAMANGRPEMHWTGVDQRGPSGYRLDELPEGLDPNRYVSELRAAVASGFWELRSRLEQFHSDPDQAARLLLRWARSNLAGDPNDRTYNDPAVLLEEMIAVNEGLMMEFGIDHSITEMRLREAFRHCHFVTGVPFVRGDANLDEELDITDAVVTLLYMFSGVQQPHDCRDAMDSDDNGRLEVTDAVAVLMYLFVDSTPLRPPFPGCDVDPSPADVLCCNEFVCPR